MQIKGTFESKMTAEPPYSEIDATSHVDMIGARNAAQPMSAGYVAIERITGKLSGRSGTFVLQHNGIMNRGTPSLDCTVVPDSGTGERTSSTSTTPSTSS